MQTTNHTRVRIADRHETRRTRATTEIVSVFRRGGFDEAGHLFVRANKRLREVQSISCSLMKVVLPDQTELELPDGATGLDAARAIGPKLAEQAVLVRANGRVLDLRLPLEDGEPIQILTTRDSSDPDALYVLRHSSAHLLAEAVRRLYPGVKVATARRSRTASTTTSIFRTRSTRRPAAHRGGDRQRAREGREWTREGSRDEAKARFESSTSRTVQLVDTAEGDISPHAGTSPSLPRPASPELEADQGAEAH
jgi:hypothetical protein